MKKLTDKDAILCVSKEEWDSIIDLYQLKISKDDYMNFESNCINVIGIGYADKKTYKSLGYKITKASKILNKCVSKKELLRRIEKLEKVVIDNTKVTVSKNTEKPKEIDWSKAGQYVESKNEIVITQKHKRDCNAVFTGVCIKKLNEDGFEVGDFSDDLIKVAFKLCTEPITLSN